VGDDFLVFQIRLSSLESVCDGRAAAAWYQHPRAVDTAVHLAAAAMLCREASRAASNSGIAVGLLDHLIRPLQERRRDRQAEGLGGLQIDDQLELGWLFNRKVGRLGPLEDLVDIPCSCS
jgi:hypothetical protein